MEYQQQQQAAETGAKCAHPSCQCQVAPGNKYCSQYCASALPEGKDGCSCGHPNCDHH